MQQRGRFEVRERHLKMQAGRVNLQFCEGRVAKNQPKSFLKTAACRWFLCLQKKEREKNSDAEPQATNTRPANVPCCGVQALLNELGLNQSINRELETEIIITNLF